MRDDELDALLSTPLAALPDEGFSARVAQHVAGPGIDAAFWASIAVAGGIAILAVPIGQIAMPVTDVAFLVAWSFPLAMTSAALALTHVAARLMSD